MDPPRYRYRNGYINRKKRNIYKTYLTNQEKRKQEMEKRRKEMMDKRGGQRDGHGDPAAVNENHECTGCGGCDKHK